MFFARTAKGRGPDLAVLCGWESRRDSVQGMLYAAEFYRVDASGPKPAVASLTDLNRKFNTADAVEVERAGQARQQWKPKFKTVAGVEKLLAKMGLPQSASPLRGIRPPPRRSWCEAPAVIVAASPTARGTSR